MEVFTKKELQNIIIDMKHILDKINLSKENIEIRKSVIKKAGAIINQLNEQKSK